MSQIAKEENYKYIHLISNILCELTDSLGWGDGIGNMDSVDYIKHLEAFQLAESKLIEIVEKSIKEKPL